MDEGRHVGHACSRVGHAAGEQPIISAKAHRWTRAATSDTPQESSSTRSSGGALSLPSPADSPRLSADSSDADRPIRGRLDCPRLPIRGRLVTYQAARVLHVHWSNIHSYLAHMFIRKCHVVIQHGHTDMIVSHLAKYAGHEVGNNAGNKWSKYSGHEVVGYFGPEATLAYIYWP